MIFKDDVALITPFLKTGIRMTTPDLLSHFSGIRIHHPLKWVRCWCGVLSIHRLKSMVMRALAISIHQIHKVDLGVYSALITPFFKTGIRMTTTLDLLCHFSGLEIYHPLRWVKCWRGVLSVHRLKSMVMRALAVSVHQTHRIDLGVYSALITPFFKTGIRMTTPHPLSHFSGIRNTLSRSIICQDIH